MKMQTFRKPHQWLNFWLEKYTDVLSTLKYSGEQRKQCWAILKLFLEELPGNPRNISLEAVEKFIAVAPEERALPVTIFYQKIAPSKPHIEMLKKFDRPVTATAAGGAADPLEQFNTLLASRDFSPRTVKNYTSSLAQFFKWSEETGATVSPETIDTYCIYLAQEKKLAPRTVALHSAALKLYHKMIVSPGVADTNV
jgi:hypothetical protein